MVSGIELRIMGECKRQGLDSEEVLQLMRVPFEWTGNSYLFDFDSLQDEKLSSYINYVFRKRGYHLEEGTPLNGIYSYIRHHIPNIYTGIRPSMKYRFKVEIYLNGGKTYLEISKAIDGSLMSIDQTVYGENYLNSELNKIVDQIIFLKPSIKGYLVCNKCGAYYEVHKDESTEDFPDKCECSGTFKYIASPKQPEEKLVERKKTASAIGYLRAPVALILVSLACISSVVYFTSEILTLGILGLAFGMAFVLIRVKSQELVFDMIYRRILYSLAAILFLVESGGLIIIWLQMSSINIITMITLIFIVIAIIFGFGMIFKVISPDNPRNFLDPPL